MDRLSRSRSNLLVALQIQFVVDVGANSGQWAKSVRINGYEGLLLSIEPTKQAFLKLTKNSVQDEKWVVVNFAIDSEEGTRNILIANNDGLSSSFFHLLPDHEKAAPEVQLVGIEFIETRKLESLISDYKYDRIFLKIDTQGSEMIVLNSIHEKTFKYIMAIEIELSLVGTYLNAPLLEEIISYLRIKKFRPYRIENGLARPNFGQQVQVDFIFIREDISNLVP